MALPPDAVLDLKISKFISFTPPQKATIPLSTQLLVAVRGNGSECLNDRERGVRKKRSQCIATLQTRETSSEFLITSDNQMMFITLEFPGTSQ